MRQLESDLWQSTVHRSGILSTHAYFLERREGNVLFYNIGDDRDLDWIADFGGIRYQLLSHRDESGPSLDRIRTRFGSKLGCSALEAPAVAGDAAPIDLIFEEGDRSLEDIEIIHTPGHTNGSICFFYRAPAGKSYLFSGDTIFQWNARWATLVLRNAGGSEEALLESLLRLRELEPDAVLVEDHGLAVVQVRDRRSCVRREDREALDVSPLPRAGRRLRNPPPIVYAYTDRPSWALAGRQTTRESKRHRRGRFGQNRSQD